MRAGRWLAALCIAAVAGIGTLGAAQGGPAPTLSPMRTGDAELAALAAPHLDGVRDRVSICVWHDGATTTAGFGADAGTRYEIGSITKTFTGVLLAEAIGRGEVGAEDPLGAHLDLGDAPVAEVTLAELAAHTSGLGEWGDDERDGGPAEWWVEQVRGGTLHGIDLPALLDRARADGLHGRGEYRYSNIGMALLGHALAEAAGTDYRTLLQRRLLDPVGMGDSGLTSADDRNPQRGYRADGRAVPHWHLGAYAPSGGGYSTAADLCAYAGMLIGGAPEDPSDLLLAITDGTRLGWDAEERDGRPHLWKTGQTGGFRAMLALDPVESRAVVVLANTAREFDELVWTLLKEDR